MLLKLENYNNESEIYKALLNEKSLSNKAQTEAKKISKKLKELIGGNFYLPVKENALVFNEVFNGCGLMAYNNEELKHPTIKATAYDIKSAYPWALITFKFPTTSTVVRKKSECGLFYCEFTECEPIYKQVDYHVVFDEFIKNKGGWISNVDYESFNKLYKSNIKIKKKMYFANCDYIPEEARKYVIDLFNNKSKIKKENPDYYPIYKQAINSASYGLFAFSYKKSSFWSDIDADEVGKTRCPHVPIAIFQTAYIRRLMIDTMIAHIDDVLYINTDGIILKASCKFTGKVGNEFGNFEKKFENKKVSFVRHCAYVVFDDIDNLIPMEDGVVISGPNVYPNEDQLEKIISGEPCIRIGQYSLVRDKENKKSFNLKYQDYPLYRKIEWQLDGLANIPYII